MIYRAILSLHYTHQLTHKCQPVYLASVWFHVPYKTNLAFSPANFRQGVNKHAPASFVFDSWSEVKPKKFTWHNQCGRRPRWFFFPSKPTMTIPLFCISTGLQNKIPWEIALVDYGNVPVKFNVSQAFSCHSTSYANLKLFNSNITDWFGWFWRYLMVTFRTASNTLEGQLRTQRMNKWSTTLSWC